MRTISVTALKARLSEQLRTVKAGERLIVTERGRPVAVLAPLEGEMLDSGLSDLVEAGLVRLAQAPLDSTFLECDRPEDPEGCVRKAVYEERGAGW